MSQTVATVPQRAVVLDDDTMNLLRGALQREGLHAFVSRSGASLAATLRAASGLAVRRGTAALIKAALAGDAPTGGHAA